MIVSASYKTDIPTFYGRWFMNRLRAGYCKMLNPYNKVVRRVALNEADAFVFWSKDLGPFIDCLPEVTDRGYPFVVQYTITGYPRELERAVVRPREAIEHMRHLSRTFGPRVGVWRYDTILMTSLTPPEWHVENFRQLAEELEGATDEVVVSFAQMYRKTKRNLDLAAEEFGFSWSDPPADAKQTLALDIAAIAKAHGMQLTMCGQREFLAPGILDAKCIDAERLSDVAGYPIKAQRKGHRPECGCYRSTDIGAYDTCPHGCVFCYAVNSPERARQLYREHDPESEFLCAHEARLAEAREEAEPAGNESDDVIDQPRLLE